MTRNALSRRPWFLVLPLLALVSSGTARAAEPTPHRLVLSVSLSGSPAAGLTLVATTDESRDKALTDVDGRAALDVLGEAVRLDVDLFGGLVAKAQLPVGQEVVEATLELRSAAGRPVLRLAGDGVSTVTPVAGLALASSGSGVSAHSGGSGALEGDALGGRRTWQPRESLSPAPRPRADGFEPDDTREDCSSIPTDGTVQARDLDPAGDEDWICLPDVACGDRIRIETMPPAAGGDTVDTFLELHDSADTLVASDDDGGSGLYSLIEYDARESGPHAIKVRGFSSTSTGNYDIAVEVSEGGTPLVVEVSQKPTADGIRFEAEALTPAPTGYEKADEAEPVIDITATGTDLSLSDDDSESIPIGFDFEFYGTVHSEVSVASNGYLTFGTDGTDLSNDCVPDDTQPNDLIAAFWDDLDPGNPGSPARVLHEVQGAAPDRMLIVTWHRVPAFPDDGEHTFQVILHETTNDVELRYGALTGDEDSDGSSATAGIENADGTEGVEHSCDTPDVLVEGTSVRFSPEPPTFVPYPSAQSYDLSEDTASIVDITGTGTDLDLGDDDGEMIPIGFDFRFYGETHDHVRVASNGYLTFADDGSDLSNDCIPDTTDPNDLVAVFWDDLDPANSGSPARILHETRGTAPDRMLIVQWHRVPAFPDDGEHTFEAILHETTNDIELRYGVLTGDEDSDGGSATAGIENSEGTDGLEASCDTPDVLVEDARFTFTATDSEPAYQWVGLATGAVLGTTDTLDWTEDMGCELELTTAAFDPAVGCERVEVSLFDACSGPGLDCGTLDECEEICESGASNHGDFVSCMAHATQRLWKSGAIDRTERQDARRAAAHSDVGK